VVQPSDNYPTVLNYTVRVISTQEFGHANGALLLVLFLTATTAIPAALRKAGKRDCWNIMSLEYKAGCPRISVVIPTWRRTRLVQRAIHSALQQTIRNIEVIVVIDGPDPETEQRLNEVRDDRLQIHVTPTNVGVSAARNVGVQMSRSEWIAFLDDDDLWCTEKLERQLASIPAMAPRDNTIVLSRYALNDFRSTPLPKRFRFDHEHLADYFFSERHFWMPSTYLVSRKLMERQPFTEGLIGVEDIDWLLRITQDWNAYIAWCADVLAVYDCLPHRPRLTTNAPWRALFEWAESNSSRLTKRSYAAFLLRNCVDSAVNNGETRLQLLRVIKEAASNGDARARDLAHALRFVMLPQKFLSLARRLLWGSDDIP
jgi:glycosyltransferase involved in cell wall biosynthesis